MNVYNGLEQYRGHSSAVAGDLSFYQYQPGQIFYPVCTHTDLSSFELRIEKCGDDVLLDYGAELRKVMVDPIKGIDLRAAVQALKEALMKLEK